MPEEKCFAPLRMYIYLSNLLLILMLNQVFLIAHLVHFQPVHVLFFLDLLVCHQNLTLLQNH